MGKLVALIAIVVSVVDGPGPAGGRGRRLGAGRLGPSLRVGTGALSGPGSGGAQPGRPIPAAWLPLYQQAAATCPGLSWSVAGRHRHGGVRTAAGPRPPGCGPGPTAPGPRARCSSSRPPSPPTPPSGPTAPSRPPPTTRWTPSTRPRPCCAPTGPAPHSTLPAAIEDYNHSDTYVDTVLTLSLAIGREPHPRARWWPPSPSPPSSSAPPTCGAAPGRAGSTARAWPRPPTAVPASPCPGWPRTSSTPDRPSPATRTVEPGDLVFFGSGPSGVDHVGLYVGAGEMIDAPHTGALVRFDDAHWPGLVGATRPG